MKFVAACGWISARKNSIILLGDRIVDRGTDFYLSRGDYVDASRVCWIIIIIITLPKRFLLPSFLPRARASSHCSMLNRRD